MKRWLLIPAAALLAFSACNDKNKKSSPGQPDAAPSAPASARASDSGSRSAERLQSSALAFADSGNAATPEAATGAGDRFFDGRALHEAGFDVTGLNGGVYAGDGGGRNVRLASLTAGPSPSRRGSSDLTTAEPPSPDAARFPPSAEAESRGAGKVLAAFDGFQKEMFAVAAPIMSRAGWNARKRKGSAIAMTPTHVTVHHTEGAQTMSEAETAAAVRGIQHYHMAGRALEGKDVWEDIGYHFLIDGAGRVIEGRPAETIGAHAGGANQDNIGVALMGNFDKIKPSAEQVESLTRLVSFLAIKYRQDPSRTGFLEGHKHYNNTDCPGSNVMAILDALRGRVDTETAELQARLKSAPAGEFVPVLTRA